MTPEKIDYVAILADMKAKRNALEASILALEAALASGTLGVAIDGSNVAASGPSPQGSLGNGQPMDLPSGAFLGKGIPEAVKLLLTAVRKRKSTKEITAALLDGGMVSTSDNFESVVSAGLNRLKTTGQLLRFPDGWGLAEWYPAGFRATAATAAEKKAPKKRRGKTPKPRPETATPGLEQKVEALLQADRERLFSLADIASGLGIKPAGLSLCMGRLGAKKKAEKVGTSYRAFSGNVSEMPKAS